MLKRVLPPCILALALMPLGAGAQEKGKGKHGRPQASSGAVVSVRVFADADRAILREYAKSFRGELPPGLARRGPALPPGLEKQLVRNGHLPPGLEKKVAPFPVELERRLSPLEPGLSRGFIAGHAVIFRPETRLILDVFLPLD